MVDLASQVADLGGFGLAVLIVLVAAIGLWKQWWVPGWLWKAERDARIQAEIQAIRNAEALEKLAKAVTREPRTPRPPAPVANVHRHDP